MSFGQSVEKVTLPECYTWAKDNFPLMQQQDVMAKLILIKGVIKKHVEKIEFHTISSPTSIC